MTTLSLPEAPMRSKNGSRYAIFASGWIVGALWAAHAVIAAGPFRRHASLKT